MALTSKKQRFADAKLAGCSNKEAAIEAGYSAATASPAGSRLVKDPDVVAYMKARRQKPAKKAKKGAAQPAPQASLPPARAGGLNVPHTDDPLVFLKAIWNDPGAPDKFRVDAAKAALPFAHQKLGEGGKKEQKKDAAKKVASRFAAAAPPKLVAAGGRKV